MRELYIDGEDIDYTKVLTPINGNSIGKHLLSMTQLTKSDVENYINETYAAESVFEDGVDLLPRKRLFALMRQPSTRTGGGFAQAMIKLGGHGQHQGGVENSSEAKKETPFDSEVAFATQTDIYAVRTEEVMGPAFAAYAMQLELDRGNLSKFVPVLNAGDGTNEHPTQTLGDYFTIHKEFGRLSGINTLLIGDYPRYRAHISYMIGAATVGMNVYVVESEVAPVPEYLCKLLGDKLHKLDRIEDALDIVDVVYPGRKPEEYDGEDYNEKRRSSILAADYQNWAINQQKLNLMSQNAIILHARPRGFELPTETDGDDRRRDVQQMEDVIKARMAIIALHLGKSIINHIKEKES